MNSEEWEKKLLGKTIIEEDTQIALDSDQVVRTTELPQGHRILPPGKPQTRDFRPERLNVFVDENNKITRAYFG
ncbi:uncharacterized protein B0P05DRAFT_541838 [Gilbertella persicaria]|uniref:uncharacterized protein n=1 Tax=Gilbertella persicaria TaxID=101096 RepID=UPI00221FB957|nr:uncharacterized protein B0P05DRAFT_541838 [Gilbertella persicaria]KAI8078957.1 hypothetical protein B0P05DRAFT_541838 [Gilbertella persicaria]